MIFYFSGTGNSEYVANAIGAKTGDRVVSITNAIRNDTFSFELSSGENLGFVMPVYFYGIPSAVLDFIDKLDIKSTGYCFCVLTCGGTTAGAGKMLQKALLKKGITSDALFAVQMVDNYIPMYEISNSEQAKQKLSAAEPKIQEIAKQVSEKAHGDFDKIKGVQSMTPVLYALYKPFRKTKKFFVTESCNGCGKCERECVCRAIEIQNGKCVWVKSECTQCLHCIHTCPQRAIQFGKNTEKRNRYYNPNV